MPEDARSGILQMTKGVIQEKPTPENGMKLVLLLEWRNPQ